MITRPACCSILADRWLRGLRDDPRYKAIVRESRFASFDMSIAWLYWLSLLQRPFLGSIASRDPLRADQPLSKNSARKSNTESRKLFAVRYSRH